MSKVLPFPKERYFDVEKFLADMELQGEKEFVVCEFAMRVLAAIDEEIENETGDVVSISNKDGERTYCISVEKVKNLIQTQLIAPVL